MQARALPIFLVSSKTPPFCAYKIKACLSYFIVTLLKRKHPTQSGGFLKKIKKLMNQAIFEKFYISNDADMEFKVDAEFKPPFDQILEPVKDDIIRINRLAQDCSSKLSYYIDIAKDHIQKIFGCGLYTINNSTNMSTYSNGSNFFSHNSSSKVLLVELRGVEPLSKSRPPYERLQFSS